MRTALVLAVIFGVVAVHADVYMQHPRGCNNRLNEANAERTQGNRMFDSQNNNRGGVNVGEKGRGRAATTANYNTPSNIYDPTTFTTDSQYPMVYYEQSTLQIEWTNQHGCGGNPLNDPALQNCNIVIQYACDNNNADPALQMGGTSTTNPSGMRDGTTTDRVETDGTTVNQGIHESVAWYAECNTRTRNKGLFLAAQTLGNNQNTAIYTRQNNNGDRNGLECAEERDYYPYWQPTPWVDIVYLTDRLDFCTGSPSFIEANSQNSGIRYKCADPNYATTGTFRRTVLDSITADTCNQAGGTWTSHTWNVPAPACQQAQWSRSNHLGNGRGLGSQMLNYNWTLPSFTTLQSIGATVYNQDYVKCVLRLRYNISTDDYDPWNTNYTSSNQAGGTSPVQNDPQVDIGVDLQSLQLAINTNQFGRTFQDRTHVFYIRQLPATLATAVAAGSKIWNLNIRGKRGNIVQTYPANEYDFVPNRMHIRAATDFVHLQWTGSNTHDNDPNDENAGDGQGGDAGEGTDGTDRHNFVQIHDLARNYPLPLDKFQDTNIFTKSNCYTLDMTAIGTSTPGVTNTDCAVYLATSGFYRTASAVQGVQAGQGYQDDNNKNGAQDADDNNNDALSVTLNNASPSLIGGVVLKINTAGTYDYISTRNNNFSNRSQKGTMIVEPAPAS